MKKIFGIRISTILTVLLCLLAALLVWLFVKYDSPSDSTAWLAVAEILGRPV